MSKCVTQQLWAKINPVKNDWVHQVSQDKKDFNIDYDDGTMQLYQNGKPLEGEQRKPMALPANGKVVYRIF